MKPELHVQLRGEVLHTLQIGGSASQSQMMQISTRRCKMKKQKVEHQHVV